jgi:hypothetical protein
MLNPLETESWIRLLNPLITRFQADVQNHRIMADPQQTLPETPYED